MFTSNCFLILPKEKNSKARLVKSRIRDISLLLPASRTNLTHNSWHLIYEPPAATQGCLIDSDEALDESDVPRQQAGAKQLRKKTCATLNNREQRVVSDDGREAWKADKQPDDQKLKPENLKSGVAAWPEKDLALLQEMSGLELTRRRRVKLQLQHNTVQDTIDTPAGTHGSPPTTVTLALCRSL